MLQLLLEPVLRGKVMTARIEGHCGTKTWRFCTWTEGRRIVDAGIQEGYWGRREIRPVWAGIEANLPVDTQDLARRLSRFETTSQNVVLSFPTAEGQAGVWMKVADKDLQTVVLPVISQAIEVLEFYLNHGVLTNGDCIAAVQTALASGVSDTISDAFFSRLIRGTARSLEVEGHYRRALQF